MVLTKTLIPTTYRERHLLQARRSRAARSNKNAGFSLIEMLIVLSIIVLIAAFAMPSVSNYLQVSINAATRDIATNIKEAYNAAIITGRVHRVVYDLKKRQFWVESGPPEALLDTSESLKKEAERKRFASSLTKKEEPPSAFKLERTITRKALELPTGVSFEDIESQKSTEPITDGKTYTHFFPHGLTEQTVIHLADQAKHKVTLVISPLLGKVDLYNEYKKGKDIFGKQ